MKSHRFLILFLVASPFIAWATIDQTYSANATVSTAETFSNVYIDAGVTVTIAASGSITCTNLDFQGANGSLIVESGGAVILSEDVLNNGSATFTIEHGGSLVTTANTDFATGNIRIEKTISSTGYSYLTTPVTTATFSGSLTEYTYAENVHSGDYGTWEPVVGGNAISPGIGYATHQSSTGIFTGTPNADQITLNLSITDKAARGNYCGHHLLGNPYTAAIDMDAFYAFGANTTNTFGTFYIWNPSNNGGAGGYDAQTTGYVASMQGFFIQLDHSSLADGNYPVTFDPSMMVADNNTTFYRKAPEYGEMVLNFSTNNDLNNRLTIRLDDAFTENFDKRYDAYSLPFEEAGQLRVKSIIADQAYDILALPPATRDIPIFLKMSEALTIEVEVLSMTSMPSGYLVELVDHKGESFELVADTRLSFDLPQIENQSGFTLRVKSTGAVLKASSDQRAFDVHFSDDQLVFRNLPRESSSCNAVLYSLGGQVVRSWQIPMGVQEHSISLYGEAGGVYLLKVVSGNQVHTEKIILK